MSEKAEMQIGTAMIQSPKELGLSYLAWRRFKKNKFALFGAAVLLILVILALIAPLVSPYDPYISVKNEQGKIEALQPPSGDHWLGTDKLGRDIFSRMVYGARVSLSVAVVAVLISTSIGIILGLISGYYGGWIDTFVMRVTDVVISFPVLFLVITVSTLLKPSIFNVMIIIGLVSWTTTSRLVRGEVLRIREMEFIEAARALGQNDLFIIFKHIFPNILAPIIVQATLQVAEAILTESSLSFLGVGVQQPIPSWGNMLNEATSITVLQFKPWVWAAPGFAILLTILSFNFLGDGLRDALDPKNQK